MINNDWTEKVLYLFPDLTMWHILTKDTEMDHQFLVNLSHGKS